VLSPSSSDIMIFDDTGVNPPKHSPQRINGRQ
jgi:hypothetical protein